MLAPHTALAGGNYRIQRHLDSGSMADVYLATDTRRMVDVAIKVLRPDLALDTYFEKYFRREATVLQKLQHPNIVRYYELVREKQMLFLVIEYIVGPTLQQYLFRRKLLPMADAFYIATALATALDFAHRHHIIHRDIKPSNVLLADNGKVMLNDFGVARDGGGTTVTGVVGTIAYMAPEQISGADVTAAADQYALGIVLWELLTGQRPFVGATAGLHGTTVSERVTEEHLNHPPPTGVLRAELASPLMRALAKNPSQRFSNCSAMVQAMLAANGVRPTTPDQWIQVVQAYMPPLRIRALHNPAHRLERPALQIVAAPVAPRIPQPSILRLMLVASVIAAIVLYWLVFIVSPSAQPQIPIANSGTTSSPETLRTSAPTP